MIEQCDRIAAVDIAVPMIRTMLEDEADPGNLTFAMCVLESAILSGESDADCLPLKVLARHRLEERARCEKRITELQSRIIKLEALVRTVTPEPIDDEKGCDA